MYGDHDRERGQVVIGRWLWRKQMEVDEAVLLTVGVTAHFRV